MSWPSRFGFACHGRQKASERGFVLATSLMMLSLLTLLSIAMYYNARSAIQTSSSAQNSTQAYYYAETGINYIALALNNNAEFDSYAPIVKRSAGAFPKATLPLPKLPSNVRVGDRYELFANLADPGPRVISDDRSTGGTTGQVMYFDNTPLADRAVCWSGSPTTPPTPTRCKNNAGMPVFDGINKKLPRYIMLTIDTSGKITPIIPALPHGAAVGTDIPKNGAIVWITAGNAQRDEDAAILPLSRCSGLVPGQSCYQGAIAMYPVAAVNSYQIVAYAIGYVNGRALRMIRSVIM